MGSSTPSSEACVILSTKVYVAVKRVFDSVIGPDDIYSLQARFVTGLVDPRPADERRNEVSRVKLTKS
ncbi:hypothetical protein K0M31_007619 [Melipona bicolor]|uniref:Uncharacterized protein n=1 Tax=Melipona bicolor TaxID=60889 RepID=A0AA40KVT8_9HYME|nr:hypothetical protein K0M31_007619 [Melipona bicolor]